MSYSIRLERNTLRFAAAHFVTFGGRCESLHGHNYDIIVQIDGALSDDSWVADFGDVKRFVREIIGPLDHKFLFATANKHLAVSRSGESCESSTGTTSCSLARTYTSDAATGTRAVGVLLRLAGFSAGGATVAASPRDGGTPPR